MKVELQSVSATEKNDFLRMAELYFRELNPDFLPSNDWKAQYFERIGAAAAERFLRWLVVAGERVGFILFGFEDHRFLSRRIGVIYELFVIRGYRGRGVGKNAAEQAIHILEGSRVSKIQLEIVVGNELAEGLWRSLGFHKVAERYALAVKRQIE